MSETVSLAEKLKSGSPVVTGWSMLAVPILAELMGRGGYEAVTVDFQHGAHDIASAREALAAMVLAGTYRLARIPVGDNATASRLLDLGAQAVIAPMINSVEEAKAFAAATKYPPLGERSWGPHRAAMLDGLPLEAYLEKANRETVSLAMIETPQAVAALDAILAVPGIDGVFVGPSDLSLTLSAGADMDRDGEKTTQAIRTIADHARAAGKIAGIFCMSPEKVMEARDAGYTLMAYGADMGLFHAAASTARKACTV
ncbi:HpcH/HpaI aldolase family protein [Roseibium aquae]|uniref:HpcH/HpaI aldolase family protein n=1 Tax=Roseibium aquae TaxID=1323746 RepID=UPI001AD8C4A1|nr:aldolase/citrate lyase family protein [Roseibium aquae]